jgi:hypothetical protein
MLIEYDVPDVPDRQVQLAEGFADLARGPAMALQQPQRRFQAQSRSSGSGLAPSPAAADEAGIAEHPRS